MALDVDILSPARGSVRAPAGCGKTQLIADSLEKHDGQKPILILTHTNAGVAALRARLAKSTIPVSRYRISTLDGFAMRLIGKFPMRSGHDPRCMELMNRAEDYPKIRDGAKRLVSEGHVSTSIRATYARLLVDEYQDCNVVQHAIVDGIANVLPTVVLGDELQAIFGFKFNRVVDWRREVQDAFPEIGELTTPWRWRRAGTEALGNWLLEVRPLLAAGQPVDLRTAPPELVWIKAAPGDIAARQRAAMTRAPNPDGTVLIISDSKKVSVRHAMASQLPTATVVETADLGDVVDFARKFDPKKPEALSELTTFANSLMTRVEPSKLLPRVQTLIAGRARIGANSVEAAALEFVASPGFSTAERVLRSLADQEGAHVYRPDVLRICVKAMASAENNHEYFYKGVVAEREKVRHRGRSTSRRAVGSTLLLKGLESDVAVILNPEELSAKELYVALTRGCAKVIVCSETPILRCY